MACGLVPLYMLGEVEFADRRPNSATFFDPHVYLRDDGVFPESMHDAPEDAVPRDHAGGVDGGADERVSAQRVLDQIGLVQRSRRRRRPRRYRRTCRHHDRGPATLIVVQGTVRALWMAQDSVAEERPRLRQRYFINVGSDPDSLREGEKSLRERRPDHAAWCARRDACYSLRRTRLAATLGSARAGWCV